MPALNGPKPRLWGGHLAEFRADRLGLLQQCAREYGDVVPLRIWRYRAFLLSRPDLIEQVLVTQARNFTKHFGLRLYKPLLGDGLLNAEGEVWRRQRKLSAPAFQSSRLAGYSASMVECTGRMMRDWLATAVARRDVHLDLMRLTLEIACRTLFGAETCPDPNIVGQAMHGAMEALTQRWRRPIPLPDWLPTPANRRLKRSLAVMDGVINGLVEQRRRSGAGDDLLWTLLQQRDDEGSGMTQRQLANEARTILLAGHETTALALGYALYLLAAHPAAQGRLQQEFAAVLAGREPGWLDLPQLRYTRRVIFEAMRLYPPADIIGREAIEECVIGDLRVPAGTTLFMSQWVMHHDARYFPDPWTFDPDRWTEEFEKSLPRFAYFPFGAGPRSCIGQTFAMTEAVLLLAAICGRFEFRPDPAFKLELLPSITLRPRGHQPDS